MSDERKIEIERTVEAPPGAVFRALTQAEELRRWFPLDARVEPGESGSIWLSWGPGCEGEAPIRVWEPGRRFGWVERAGSPDAPVELAVDFHLRPVKGGTVVRLVHSGFGRGADWDDHFDAVEDGWTYFMYNLRHYLGHHAGTPRQMAWVRRRGLGTRADVWEALTGPGGVADLERSAPAAGARVRLLPATVDLPGAVAHGREGHCLAVRVPGLEEALLFVEMEGSGDPFHTGVWLSTWGLPEDRVRDLQDALEEATEGVLG